MRNLFIATLVMSLFLLPTITYAQQTCVTQADLDCSGDVNLTEVVDYIGSWYGCSSCNPELFQVIEAYYGIYTSPIPAFPTDYVSYWKFDGDTSDSGPGGNNGTVVDALFTSNGKVGKALGFDGAGDYVVVPRAGLNFFTDEMTLSAWIKGPEQAASNAYAVSKYDQDYMFYAEGTDRIGFYITTTGGGRILGDDTANLDNTWHHFVAIYNGSYASFYVDNVIQGTPKALTGDIVFDDRSGSDFFIGCFGAGFRCFNGTIDEVMIYDRALSGAEILQIYSKQSECQIDDHCDDKNDCTINTCDASNLSADSRGCVIENVGIGAVCNDGLFCTIAGTSTCDGLGNCQAGTLEDCSETPDIACTDDVCVEGPSSCIHQHNTNHSNCNFPVEICDVLLGCVANPCDGISSCINYGDSGSCGDDACKVGPIGCNWNVSVCEEVPFAYKGFGAVTLGANDPVGCPGGPEVYNVTSLSDDGSSGTLRDAVSQGCRYIVFDDGGTIVLTSTLPIRYDYTTIDGSSAPYPGITINQGPYATEIEPWSPGDAHDIIVNNIRFVGPGSGGGGDMMAITANGGGDIYNVIVDHCTMTAVGDGIDIIVSVNNVTYSWNFFHNNQLTNIAGFGSVAKPMDGISYHHNVYAKNEERQMLLDGNIVRLDFVNNVVYGWDFLGGMRTQYDNSSPNPNYNMENNYYYMWANGFYDMPDHAIVFYGGQDANSDYYFSGNIFPNGEKDNVSTGPRLPIPAWAEVTHYDASTLGDTVLPFAGTNYPTQEEQDLLDDIRNAVGGHVP